MPTPNSEAVAPIAKGLLVYRGLANTYTEIALFVPK
jgi:hypothetical protein